MRHENGSTWDLLASAFDYDLDGSVEQIQDVDTRDHVLDAAGRLTEVDIGGWPASMAYGYDEVGNRMSKIDNASSNGWNHAYGFTHNRLISSTPVTAGTPGSPVGQSYDANGSLVSDGMGLTLGYDASGRLVSSNLGGSGTTQVYNGLGQRVSKVVSGSGAGTTLFFHDELGRILGSYVPDTGEPNGFRVLEELVWLDGFRPLASVRPNATNGMTVPDYFPVLTDHLGTPRKVLDGNGATRWSWDAKESFGNESPNENPSVLGVFMFNLRFPGQWFDQETGLHHNGFLDYHPGLGRYVQSDSLGLMAGRNICK